MWSCFTFFLSGTKVGQLKPNGLGLYDMAGIVSEWCQDWYAADYYIHSAVDNPQGPKTGRCRVCRSGQAELSMRTSARDSDNPNARKSYNGFRLAMSGSK